MALTGTALASQPRPQTNSRPRPKMPMIAERSYQADFLGVREKMDASWNEATQDYSGPPIPVIEFKFVVVLPGADEAQRKLEVLPFGPERDAALAAFEKKFLNKGHGRYFWLTVNKPKYGVSLPKPGQKLSNLYIALRGLLADGAELTAEQVRDVAALLNALENRSFVGTDAQGNEVYEPTVPDEAFVRPQYGVYITADPSKQRNKLTKIAGRVPEDELLPSWRPLPRVADPREAELDDPTVVCEQTGDVVYGYEVERDGQKVWFSNTELAEVMKRKVGRVLRNDLYRAELRKLDTAAAAASNEVELPF